jgi:hypothetical protein
MPKLTSRVLVEIFTPKTIEIRRRLSYHEYMARKEIMDTKLNNILIDLTPHFKLISDSFKGIGINKDPPSILTKLFTRLPYEIYHSLIKLYVVVYYIQLLDVNVVSEIEYEEQDY